MLIQKKLLEQLINMASDSAEYLNEKWITVKPHGEDSKGTHVLVKDGETSKEAVERKFDTKPKDKKEDKKDKFNVLSEKIKKTFPNIPDSDLGKMLALAKESEESYKKISDEYDTVSKNEFMRQMGIDYYDRLKAKSEQNKKNKKAVTLTKKDILVDKTHNKPVFVTELPETNSGYYRLAYTKGLSKGSSTWDVSPENIEEDYWIQQK